MWDEWWSLWGRAASLKTSELVEILAPVQLDKFHVILAVDRGIQCLAITVRDKTVPMFMIFLFSTRFLCQYVFISHQVVHECSPTIDMVICKVIHRYIMSICRYRFLWLRQSLGQFCPYTQKNVKSGPVVLLQPAQHSTYSIQLHVCHTKVWRESTMWKKIFS